MNKAKQQQQQQPSFPNSLFVSNEIIQGMK